MELNKPDNELPLILIAEDDPDDRFLIKKAFHEIGYSNSLIFVEDGEELMDFLLGRKKYAERGPITPMCILLDLKMPRKDGREALREIRKIPKYSSLPILILSTSDSNIDREYCFNLGISDYITKPDNYLELLTLAERAKKICLP